MLLFSKIQTRSLPLRTLGLVAVSLVVHAQALAQKNSFESLTDQIPPRVSTQNGKASASKAHATDGTYSMKVVFSKQPAGVFSKLRVTPKTSWNFKNKGGIIVDVTNPMSYTVSFGLSMTDTNGKIEGTYTTIESGATVSIALRIDPSYLKPRDYGLTGFPNPYPGIRVIDPPPTEGFDVSHIVRFEIYMRGGRPASDTLYVDNVRPLPEVTLKSALDDMVDDLGQYSKATWPGKITSREDLISRIHTENLDLLANRYLPNQDNIGARKNGPWYSPPGYFGTKKIDGKWWLLSPTGKPYWLSALSALRLNANETNITKREYMFKSLPKTDGPEAWAYTDFTGVTRGPASSGTAVNLLALNLSRKYGPDWFNIWKERTIMRMVSWGFNGIGKGSEIAFYRNGRLPYLANLLEMGDFARVDTGKEMLYSGLPDPYDPDYRKAIEVQMQRVSKTVDGDPLCIGFQLGNEPIFSNFTKNGEFAIAYGAMSGKAKRSPAKRAFLEILEDKYGSIDSLNKAWDTTFKSWKDLEDPTDLPEVPNGKLKADMKAYILDYARTYFRVGRETIKKYAPNHMYLGPAIYLFTPEVLQAASELCDVICLNIYNTVFDEVKYAQLRELDRPCMITEYHIGALDRGGIHPGLIPTASQELRAATWQTYLRSILDNPCFVGACWYRAYDQPITGELLTAENYATGFIDNQDNPYPEMREMARSLNREIYDRRW
ncbi:hypothetical protein EON82_02870 [bacterium]|nr:MAG: hypothetical protein EON82_02870 [bacterium]